MKNKFSYQQPLIEETFSLLKSRNKVLLAACPGAGKTVMAIRIIERYKKEFKNAKIVILAHGQSLLRDQWDSQIRKFPPHLDHGITIEGGKLPKKNVIVGLPQNKHALLKMKSCDLLVVDEAHHFYHGTMVQELINALKPKHQMILTGTPSIYVDEGGWSIVGITIQELLKYGSITDPEIQLVEAQYSVKLQDYNNQMNLNHGKVISNLETDRTLDHVLSKLISKLGSEDREKPIFTENPWSDVIRKLQKTMIISVNQAQALRIAHYFTQRGLPCVLSISDRGDGIEELEAFRRDKSKRIFIVVNRGILGFDFDQLMNVIDLSASLNSDRLFQMLCRVVRKNHDRPDQKKLFIKVTNAEMAPITFFVMSFVVAMSDPRYYFHSRTSEKRIMIPVPKAFMDIVFTQGNTGREKTNSAKQFPDLPDVMSFQRIEDSSGADVKTIAYTNFRIVKKRLYSKTEFVIDLQTCKDKMALCKTRREFRHKYRNCYEFLINKEFRYLMDEKWGKTPDGSQYNVDAIIELSKNYPTKSKFRESHNGAYKWLKRQNKHNLLSFERSFKRWTKELALEEAKKCSSRRELNRRAGGAEDFLERNGLLPECRKFWKDDSRRFWTTEKALEKAGECKNIRELRAKFPGAETFLRRNNQIELAQKVFDDHSTNRTTRISKLICSQSDPCRVSRR